MPRSSVHSVIDPSVPRPHARRGLGGIRLESRRIEVRLTRAAAKARLFGRPAQATRIGRFVVLERVGMGGMGIVYAAYDPQLDRRVALKVMRDDVVRSRRARHQALLLREARAMAKLSHPNVVAVFDAGTVDDQVFVAMEFIEAVTLRAWMKRARTEPERLAVFEQAGRGLATAHQAGLVHRDFKPENVLVPEHGAVRVTDFGLARAVDPGAPAGSGTAWRADESAAGLSLARAGTPPYMSPQQLRGEAIDARADQWAFCVALYECFAGHRPFDPPALTRLAGGDAVPVPAMPEGAGAGPHVHRAIARGLSVDPDARFPSMEALLDALRPPRRSPRATAAMLGGVGGVVAVSIGVGSWWHASEPACPRATARLEGVWDREQKSRLALALDAASPALGADTWARVRSSLDPYVEQWLDLRQRSCRAAEDGELSPELLDLRMTCLDARHGELTALVDTLAEADAEIVEHAVESAVRLSPLPPCMDPRVLRERTPPAPAADVREAAGALRATMEHARALRRAGKAAEGLALLDPALDAAEALGDPTTSIELRLERGRLRAALAQRDGAVEDFDAVIERAGRARYLGAISEAAVAMVDVVGVDQARVDAGLDLARMASVAIAMGADAPLARARLQLARGRVLFVAGRTEEGLEATEEGLATLGGPDAGERARLEQASALRLIAKLALARDDHARSRDHARRALVIFEDLLGAEHPEVAETLSHEAAAALRIGEFDAARARFERAAAIQRKVLGEAHPDYGRTLSNLGATLQASGDLAGARQRFRRAAEILEDAMGPDDFRVAQTWANIAAVETDLGQLEAANTSYTRALAGLRRSLGERHPVTALALTNLGRLQLTRGEISAAQQTLRRSLELREEILGPAHIQTARSRHALAEALAAGNAHEQAIEQYEQALAALLEGQGPAGVIAEARVGLGQSVWRRGDRARARALFERAWPSLSPTARLALDAWCGGRCER